MIQNLCTLNKCWLKCEHKVRVNYHLIFCNKLTNNEYDEMDYRGITGNFYCEYQKPFDVEVKELIEAN